RCFRDESSFLQDPNQGGSVHGSNALDSRGFARRRSGRCSVRHSPCPNRRCWSAIAARYAKFLTKCKFLLMPFKNPAEFSMRRIGQRFIIYLAAELVLLVGNVQFIS